MADNLDHVKRLRLVLVLVVASPACTRANPAFEDDGGGDEAVTSGAEGTTAPVLTSDDATATATASAEGGGSASASGTSGGSGPDSTTASVADSSSGPLPGESGDTSAASETGTSEPVRALLVTQYGDLSLPLDATLHAALQTLALEVVVVEDVVALPSDADEVELVVISETVTAVEVGATFREVARPVIAVEGGQWGDLGMVSSLQWLPVTQVFVVDPAHPIAAGLAGEVALLDGEPGSGVIVGEPGPSAAVIARAPTSEGAAVVFAFEAGALMGGGSMAPARRVGLGADVDANGALPSPADLSDQGVAMFVAAVQWALS